MKGYNHITLVGNIVRDPDMRYTPDGKAVTKFTVAVNRNFKKEGQDEVDFIPVVTFGKLAEICGEYLKKGTSVLTDGRLAIRSYEKDGQKVFVTEVIADEVNILSGSKPKTDEN